MTVAEHWQTNKIGLPEVLDDALGRHGSPARSRQRLAGHSLDRLHLATTQVRVELIPGGDADQVPGCGRGGVDLELGGAPS